MSENIQTLDVGIDKGSMEPISLVDIAALKNDPEFIKSLLKSEQVKSILSELDKSDKESTKKQKECVSVSSKNDRYGQFTGIVITVCHRRVQNGKKTYSIRANGRSQKECAIEAEQQVLNLKKRYKIA